MDLLGQNEVAHQQMNMNVPGFIGIFLLSFWRFYELITGFLR